MTSGIREVRGTLKGLGCRHRVEVVCFQFVCAEEILLFVSVFHILCGEEKENFPPYFLKKYLELLQNEMKNPFSLFATSDAI